MEVLTNRNKQIVIHEGYQYIFDKLGADQVTKLYRCRRRDIHCKGRIMVSINGVIEMTGNHGGHEESPVGIEVSGIGTLVIHST